MTTILITRQTGEPSFSWGPDERDALDRMARRFKAANDQVGLYLCAIVELLAAECLAQPAEIACHVEVSLVLALAQCRELGVLHEAAHEAGPPLAEFLIDLRNELIADREAN